MTLISPILLLITAVTVAAIIDIRSSRIPNWITLSLIVAAPIFFGIYDGLPGLLFSFFGIAVGMATLIFFYLGGGMGAGDVKLMGAVGGIVGAKGALLAFVCTALVGGVYALGLLAFHGKLAIHFKKYWETFKGLVLAQKISYAPDPPEEALPRLRYGVAIAAGTLLSLGPGSGLLG